MEALLQQLESYIRNGDKVNTKISAASVNWHIAHSLLVINGISKTVLESNPADYKWRFNFVRTIVFLKGGIPRGKGKSPHHVAPNANFSNEALLTQLKDARQYLEKIKIIQPKQHFKHPVFGVLDAKQTQKLLVMHTNHHLNIIKDILA
jgi:hypothetical protein